MRSTEHPRVALKPHLLGPASWRFPPGTRRGAAHLGVQQLHPLTGLDQLLLSQLPRPLRLLHHGPQLLQLGLQQVVAPFHDGDVLLQVVVGPYRVVQLDLGVLWIRGMGMMEGAVTPKY